MPKRLLWIIVEIALLAVVGQSFGNSRQRFSGPSTVLTPSWCTASTNIVFRVPTIGNTTSRRSCPSNDLGMIDQTLGPAMIPSLLTVDSSRGSMGIPTVNNIVYVDGVDNTTPCAAEAALGSNPGAIYYTPQNGGTLGCSLKLGTGQVLVLGPGAYSLSGNIVAVGIGSGITGLTPCTESNISNGDSCPVTIKQADRVNLTDQAILLSGRQSFLYNVTLDGNKATNSKVPTIGVKMTGNRTEIANASIQNWHGAGVEIDGSPAPPGMMGCDGLIYCTAEGANVNHIQSAGNDGNDLTVLNQTDVFAHFSKFETSGGWGAQVTNGTLFADTFTDFGGNALGGAECVTTTSNYNLWCALIFHAITAGANAGPAIYQSGWNGSTIANGASSITNSSIANGAGLGTSQDLIHFEDVVGVLIAGNTVQCVSISRCRYGINLVKNFAGSSSGSIVNNVVEGNFTNTNSTSLGNNLPINLGSNATVQFALNNENGASDHSLTGARLLNGHYLTCTNDRASIKPCFGLSSSNHLELLGDPSGSRIDLVPDGGTTRLGFTSRESIFPNGWSACWQNTSALINGCLELDGSNNFVFNNGNSEGGYNFEVKGTPYLHVAAAGNFGNNIPIVASFTTTSASSDRVMLTGMTSSGHCALTATNATAAANSATTYIFAKTANQITIAHAAISGMAYDILCTPN